MNDGDVKIREHLRCPLCGRLASMPLGPLPKMFRSDHVIEVRRQACVGRFVKKNIGEGFRWSSRPLRRGETKALLALTESVTARLEDVVEHAREPPTDPKEFEAWCVSYLADAEDALTLAEVNLSARKREIARFLSERKKSA